MSDSGVAPAGSEPQAKADTSTQAAPPSQAPGEHESRRDAGNEKEPKRRPPWLKPLLLALLMVALVIGVPWGVGYWRFIHTHVSTDDAYVTGNLTNIGPIVSGTLTRLYVDEGNYVKRGQLIAELDPAGPEASVRQAEANYRAALSQIPQAERNLAYQRRSTEAAIRRARATLEAQRAKTRGAAEQVALASGTTVNQSKQARAEVTQARAQFDQWTAQARAADANVANYRQGIETALEALANYRQQVTTADAGLVSARARVAAAQADADRTARDEDRYRVLYVEDAVSAQNFDQARNAARDAGATLEADRALVDQAASQVEQARASARQAESQVEQARKSVEQAEAQANAAWRSVDAAREQVRVAQAGVGVARANELQVGVQRANLVSTTQEAGENEADISTAEAGREQVAVRQRQIATYRAQAAAAREELINAQITLNDTYIYAPSNGIVVHKDVNVGAALSPGQTIVTVSQGDYAWVEANFKETQLTNVAPGEPVEIDVDAFPGKTFRGHVRSVNEASGAATSLLPPDNATGNFTKVVQRIPVRIEFDAAGPRDDKKYARERDILQLRQGMSVVPTIDTTHVDRYRAQANRERDSIDRGRPSGYVAGGAPGAGVQGAVGQGAVNGAEGLTNGATAPTNGANSATDANNGANGASGPSNGANGMSGQPNAQSGTTGPNAVPNPGAGQFNGAAPSGAGQGFGAGPASGANGAPTGPNGGHGVAPTVAAPPGLGTAGGPQGGGANGAPGTNGGQNGMNGAGRAAPGAGTGPAGVNGTGTGTSAGTGPGAGGGAGSGGGG